MFKYNHLAVSECHVKFSFHEEFEHLHVSVEMKVKAWVTKAFQGVQVSSKLQQVLASEPIPFFLGPLRDTHAFLLSSSDPYSFLGLISLRKVSHQNFSQKGEFDGSDQKSQPGELNGPSPSFICSISDGTIPESGTRSFIPVGSATVLFTGKNLNWYWQNSQCTSHQDSNRFLQTFLQN